jgi:hypothetical protein
MAKLIGDEIMTVPIWGIVTILYIFSLYWSLKQSDKPYDFSALFYLPTFTVIYLLYWVFKLTTGWL